MAYLAGTDLCTLKDCARATISTSITASGTTNVSVASLVPAGTKAIEIRIYMTDGTVAAETRVQETGTAVTEWSVITQVANVPNNGCGRVKLDSSLTFDITNSEAIGTHQIYLLGYYI
jgi:hypothetical protein